MKPILISVVIPTLDTKELTVACVDAVLGSELPAGTTLEVIVVDDGGRDGTAETLSGRPGVRILRNEETTGFSRAVNRGVAEATGDLLVFLNSDATVEPTGLARLAEAFAADASLGIAGAALRFPDGAPQWSGGREPNLPWLFAQASAFPAFLGRFPAWRRLKPLHPASVADVGWVSGAAMAVRASVWRELGPFDVSFAFYVQDLDFCLRARDRGWRVCLLPEFRAFHHQGATISSTGEEGSGSAGVGLLWNDLVLWAAKRKGLSFARRAHAAISVGAALRIAARRLSSPFLSASRRAVWRRETAALSEARAGLGRPQLTR